MPTLKDYRASHFILNFVVSQVQGWYTRENILHKAGHPDGSENSVAALGKLLDKAGAWHAGLKPGAAPFILDAGTIGDAALAEDAAKVLGMLFAQYKLMSDRLNGILDQAEPLHTRRRDFQYVIAFMGWAYYALNHAVRGDLAFAKAFSDTELLKAREGHEEASQKEISFVNYIFNMLGSDTVYNPETARDLAAMAADVMNEHLKNSAQQSDRYLSALGK